MIPKQYRGSPPSQCSKAILDVLTNGGALSHADIKSNIAHPYHTRTINKYLAQLRNDGKIERVINGDMRRPRYRIKQ